MRHVDHKLCCVSGLLRALPRTGRGYRKYPKIVENVAGLPETDGLIMIQKLLKNCIKTVSKWSRKDLGPFKYHFRNGFRII